MEEPCFKFEFWLRLSTPRILKYFQSSTFFHFKQFSFVVSFVCLNGERCNDLSQWLINIQPQSNEFPTSSSFSILTQYQFMNLTAPPVATGRWETRIRMELRNRSFASDNIEGRHDEWPQHTWGQVWRVPFSVHLSSALYLVKPDILDFC